MHLVDTTLFYSPTSGGVKRYLNAKHAWLQTHTAWEHTIVVPGREDRFERGEVCTLGGFAIPGTFNYRLPVDPRRWTDILSALEPSIIEAGDAFHPALCAAYIARRKGIPVAAFYHSNLPQIIGHHAGGLSERLLGRYVRWVYDHVDVVFAPSRLMCAYLNHLGVHHTLLQPLGVDTKIFRPERRAAGLHEKLGLARETRVLVYAGRFAGEKNLPILLQAFARLGRPYHLLMIGGEREARPSSNVTMLPYRKDSLELAQWLASSDALVHAGTKETFGLVILEAMACGRPVIAARAGAIPEFVDDTVGLLAEPNSVQSMMDAIVALYERDIDAIGMAARERVLQRFTWNQAFHSQMSAYAALIGAHRPIVPAYEVIELRSPST
jgi:alpha-1,6-mannosyltransferase